MTHKVSFQGDGGGALVYIDGVIKGHISSGYERYVSVVTGNDAWTGATWQERITIARFKYHSPMRRAKEFCKEVFSVLDPKSVVHYINHERVTPLDLQKRIQQGEIFLPLDEICSCTN